MNCNKLKAHVHQLCRKNKIRIRYAKKLKRQGHANFDLREIEIRPVLSHTTYAIAIHEIGHLLNRSQSRPILEQEALAWLWAKKHALCWSPTMERVMRRGLQSYLDCARQHQTLLDPAGLLRLPPRHSVFWELLPTQHAPTPKWLHESHVTVPWRDIVHHPDRPRCENCMYWRPLKNASIGECMHKNTPLGLLLTPASAFCGSDWIRHPQADTL